MNKKRIIEWVNNINNESKKVLFVYGKVGSGKCKYITDNLKNDYKINSFTYIDFLYSKNILKVITQTNNSNNVFFMLTKKKKPLIIIKEVEFIKIKTIKNILKELNIKNIKKNKNKINIPIILIGSGQCIKPIKDLEDICEVINFNEEENNINIKDILDKKNIILDEKIKNMIKKCDNYNKINLLINFFSNFKNNKNIITFSNIKNIHNILINSINYNTELYENVKEILVKEIKINDIFNYYYLEKILLPLLIHENYKTYVLKNFKTKKDMKECIKLISNNLMKGDMLNEFIFNNHVWNIQDLFAIIYCQYTSYLLNKKYKKKGKILKPKLDYTKILTKNSVLFMNFKQYKTTLHVIKYEHNFDKTIIEYINKNILIYLTHNISYGNDYLLKYGFTKKDLLKIIKFSNEYYYINNSSDIKKSIEKNLRKL